MRDVANHAGVSVGTVSYTLNNPGRVADETRERVIASMNELGFVRNDLARQLKVGAGTTVGMIVLDIANPFFAALAHACQGAAETAGLDVILGSSNQSPGREDRYLELFEEQRVRGVLVASINGTTPRMQELASRGVPVITFDPYATGEDFCSVALDGAAAGEIGLRHLAETGRDHVALVGGPYPQLRDRWDGARSEAARLGLTVSVIDTDGQTYEEGRRVGTAISELPVRQRPDAVFAGNDFLAVGVEQSLLAAGLSVPHDIAVLGIDGTPWSESASVPITTLAQPSHELAHRAFELLQAHIADPAGHEHSRRLVMPELVKRASTGQSHA